MNKNYDVICIGSGPGGYTAAIRASQLGKRVAVIDISEDRIGGTCLNEGCVPVKSLIHNSKSFFFSKKEINQISAEMRKTVQQLRNGVKYLFKKNEVVFIEGKASLIDNVTVKIKNGNNEEVLTAKYIILATGSYPKAIPNLQFDGKRIISSNEAICMEKIPEDITIIGGGAIGVEFAQLFKNFGSQVKLIEILSRIMPLEDSEISSALETILKRKGIEVVTEAKITPDDMNREIVLVSVGREPNTKGLNLGAVSIDANNGFIKVDEMMRTSVENIFAIGDIVPTPMFAHTASEEAVIASECIGGLDPEPINYLNVPRIVYGDIETASFGLTEDDAKRRGYDVKIAKHFFRANSRSVINGQKDGFIKIIADNEDRALLGVHIIGSEAAEIIHPFLVAKTAGLSVDELSKVIYGHPTVSEAIKDACKQVFDKPIHG